MASQFTISPRKCSAKASPKADFPVPVEPTIATTFRLCVGGNVKGSVISVEVMEPGVQSGVVPAKFRGLRACLVCGLVKTQKQFEDNGCENCTFLNLTGDKERVQDCTTTHYQGSVECITLFTPKAFFACSLLLINDPAHSWVARYQGIEKRIRGCYAIKVTGVLAPEILSELESKRIRPLCLS